MRVQVIKKSVKKCDSTSNNKYLIESHAHREKPN